MNYHLRGRWFLLPTLVNYPARLHYPKNKGQFPKTKIPRHCYRQQEILFNPPLPYLIHWTPLILNTPRTVTHWHENSDQFLNLWPLLLHHSIKISSLIKTLVSILFPTDFRLTITIFQKTPNWLPKTLTPHCHLLLKLSTIRDPNKALTDSSFAPKQTLL